MEVKGNVLTNIPHLPLLLPSGGHREAHKSLANFLKSLPKACFAPQSFEIMRTLLGDSMSLHQQQQQQHVFGAGAGGGTGGPTAGSSPLSALPSSSPSMVIGAGGGSASEAVNSWPALGDSMAFLRHLPVGYSLGTALRYLEAVLQRVKREVMTDWQVMV